MSRRSTRSKRGLLWALAVVVIVGGLAAVAYFTPLMSVRSIEVTGTREVSTDQILSAAAIPKGAPLLQVDTAPAARRVAAIADVAQVRIQRSYPSKIVITVTEREPVVRVVTDTQIQVLDKTGVAYRHYDKSITLPPEISKLPSFSTPNPGPTDPTTKAVLPVIADLPAFVADQLLEVHASSPVDIQFVLRGNKTVVWGDSDRTADKAEALRLVMTQRASSYNVSSPESPAYK
ncbi:FtsQ-type POTRA domain-containing protein [Gordonia sp. TBRC 11910]|uniref:FtsQ-type POTRA domain-containing protein n=1 Tax=Gordonia asplenii TaxID=2725283 RepID=A0A848KXE9_9ACTN|nr:FtsQ-type POTRA domain-containing protein [Gordonia asplenii]NMO03320.1 FtsQ-type POTRA domain-containing protein [Gordonia asplenii]